MSIRTDLCELGVPGAVAAEIQSQILTGIGNAIRLKELGFVAAEVFARGVSGGNLTLSALVESSVVPEVAKVIVAATAP